MDAIPWIFVALLFLAAPITIAVWLIARTLDARNRLEEVSRRLRSVEAALFQLTKERETQAEKPRPITPAAAPAKPADFRAPDPAGAEIPQPTIPPPIQTPPAFPKPVPPAAPAMAQAAVPPPIVPTSTSAPRPAPSLSWSGAPRDKAAASAKPGAKIDWEQFMGVKLFAWIAGLALFLGVAFFIKYSFEKNWITPELRVIIGFVAGTALLIGGSILHRNHRYIIGAQALCATGVVILYANTYACRSFYHFPFFGPIATFLLMVLITTAAFFLAVRLNALVVAVLGMLGGFITPILVSTGVDHPFGLFGYVAVLDIGLILVALHRRWFFLASLGALGTAIMQIGWAQEFFESGKYFEGDKIFIPLGVLVGFILLYLAATWLAFRRDQRLKWLSGSVLGLAAVAFVFACWFTGFPVLAHRPWLIFSFVFVIDLALTAVAVLDHDLAPAQSLAGLAVFGLLAVWTVTTLKTGSLNAALTFYLVFAIVHSAFPVLLQRRRVATGIQWAGQVFPPLALALVLIPILQLTDISFVVWPFVLVVDLLAIGLAVVCVSILPVIIVLLLTLAAVGALIFKIPTELTGLPTSFFLIGAFAVFFFATGIWLARRFKPGVASGGVKLGDDLSVPGNLAAQLPAISAVLPFLLLMMATLRLPLANPSPVFGLALLLVVLVLGVTKLFSLDWMPAVGLACVVALESTWHFQRFDPADPTLPLIWYLVFFGVFTLFPFLFSRQFSSSIVPWATAAMAGPPHFLLIHRLVKAAYPNPMMGLLPAVFALPALVSLVMVLKQIPKTNPVRMGQLAWFGGVALFFITLIFPIQFERQWITIGWALEGAALLWLFHRVPHPGLQMTGVGLLIAAFFRLANPAVLKYHARSATPIFNWYLYAYSIVILCLFAGARLMAPPRNRLQQTNAPPILIGLGTVLAFLLLNIEIADFFSPPGEFCTFEFKGNFTRDMTYSIAWALFALAMLVIGIVKKAPAFRYTAVALLCVTLIKLFLHDLTQLGEGYRIGAFLGVAVIVFLASFAYQRFFAATVKGKDEDVA